MLALVALVIVAALAIGRGWFGGAESVAFGRGSRSSMVTFRKRESCWRSWRQLARASGSAGVHRCPGVVHHYTGCGICRHCLGRVVAD